MSALLGSHDAAAGASYLALWIAQYLHCRWLACTRCPYYRKRCSMLGGEVAALLFPRRAQARRMPDDAMIASWWAVVTLAPIALLIAWGAWLHLALTLGLSLGWHGLHHVLACRRCGNSWCPLNAAKGERA